MYAQTHIDMGLLRAGESTDVGRLLRAGTNPESIRVCSPAVLTQVKFAQGGIDATLLMGNPPCGGIARGRGCCGSSNVKTF